MARADVFFTIPGDPKSKGRPRFTRYGKAYTPKSTVEAETRIKEIAQEAFAGVPFTEAVGVEITFYCATMRRTDLSNLCKTVEDAMNTVAYTDDYLVEELQLRLYRKIPGEAPRTEVLVYKLETP